MTLGVQMVDVGIHLKGEVNLQILLDRVKRELEKDVGAIGCFIGVVRGVSKDGEKVKFLRYECSEHAVGKLEEIAREFESRPNIRQVMIHHVVDEVRPGQDAIYVVVAGYGRNDVFKVLPEIMDRIKMEVPIWKKEVTEKGEYWVPSLV